MVADSDSGAPAEVPVRLDAHGLTGHYVFLTIHKTAPVAVELTAIGMQVDYGFTVVDPTEALNAFDTHVNLYDAHPNGRAQQVVADAVYQAMHGRP